MARSQLFSAIQPARMARRDDTDSNDGRRRRRRRRNHRRDNTRTRTD